MSDSLPCRPYIFAAASLERSAILQQQGPGSHHEGGLALAVPFNHADVAAWEGCLFDDAWSVGKHFAVAQVCTEFCAIRVAKLLAPSWW